MATRTNRRLLLLVLVFIIALIIASTAVIRMKRVPSRPQGHIFVFTCSDPGQSLEVRIPDAQGEDLIGTTPFTVDLTLGDGPHSYIASAPGYRPDSGQLIIQDNRSVTHIEIPALTRLGGSIQVRSTATATVLLRGPNVTTTAPVTAPANAWTDLGYYQPGNYTVQSATAVGIQEKPAQVGESGGAQVEFAWGSLVVVEVSPTNAPSLTVTLDGSPYTAPRNYSSADIQRKTFVEVSVSAAGYLPGGDVAFLAPGEITTVTISLTPQPQQDNILSAYRFFWYTLINGMNTVDASAYPNVMTGTVLAQQTNNVGTLASVGARSAIVSVSPHTPTITLADQNTAILTASYDLQITTIHSDGREDAQPPQHYDATFTLTADLTGTWRAAGWTTTKLTSPTPTSGPRPTAGPAPTPGGSSNPTPAPSSDLNSPAIVEQIIFQSINCLRSGQGLNTLTWDETLYAAMKNPQPDTGISLADMASRSYRDTGNYPPTLIDRISAAASAAGGYIVGIKGVPLSYMASRVGFAYDWGNYVNNPCATGYGTGGGEAWAGPFSSIAIAIGEPYKAGTLWKATVIFVAR